MADTSPELRAAIDVAKQRIKVDSYYAKAMNHGLKGNAQGFWSGTALGMFTGAMAGGLMVAALSIATVTLPFAPLFMILGLAGIGGTMGGVTGARIGAGSGAIAGTTAELERRLRGDKLEKEILNSPQKQREVIEAYRKDPVVEKSDTVCETYATTRGRGNAFHKIVSGKTMLATVAICTVASMFLFAATALIAPASFALITGLTGLKAALLVGAGAGAATGISFGIAYPPIFASLTKHTAHLLSQNYMQGKKLPHIQTVREIEAEARLNRDLSEGNVPKIYAPMLKPAADVPATNVSDVIAADRLATPERQLNT